MGEPKKIEAWDDEPAIESRRHPPASELRLPDPSRTPPLAGDGMSDELRASLWSVIHASLFAPHEGFDPWTSGVTGRPAVRRVWSSPPLSGDPERMPDDVVELVESWFSLVEPSDALELVETVHESLDPSSRPRFAEACNGVFGRGSFGHRFVMRRLVPIASAADAAAIEKAVAACRQAGLLASERALIDAVARLAVKPEPDARGAAQEAIRAVEAAVHALTGERHLSLEDALHDLKERGVVSGALEAAHRGVFAYAAPGHRGPTLGDARLIVVMCAGLARHLACRR